jgi:hypothetical protein
MINPLLLSAAIYNVNRTGGTLRYSYEHGMEWVKLITKPKPQFRHLSDVSHVPDTYHQVGLAVNVHSGQGLGTICLQMR